MFLSDKGFVSLARTTLTTANLIRRVNIGTSPLRTEINLESVPSCVWLNVQVKSVPLNDLTIWFKKKGLMFDHWSFVTLINFLVAQ